MGKEYKDFELEQFDEGNAFAEVLPNAVAVKQLWSPWIC